MFSQKRMLIVAAVGLISLPVFAADAGGQSDVQQQLQALQQQVAQLQSQVNQSNARVSNTSPNATSTSAPRVTIGPYLNQSAQFNGSDLIINDPNILADEALLQARYDSSQEAKKLGLPEQAYPYLTLSGVVESQLSYSKPYVGSHTSDIDLTDVEIDAYAAMSHWVTGLINIAYNNDVEPYSDASVDRVNYTNSRVYVNKAFVTFGDFTKTPLFGSVGQMYVPFGRYASYMVTAPLTRPLGRTKARAIELGYAPQGNGVYGGTYIYRGVTGKGSRANVGSYGFDGGVKYAIDSGSSIDFGMGFISDLSDSQGMSDTGGPSGTFQGFGYGNAGKLVHAVHGLNAHTSINYHPFNLVVGYVTAMSAFNAADMTFNGRGAKPSALNTELAWDFSMGYVPASWAIGYGRTKDALAIGLPQKRYSTTVSMSFWKDTVLGLEFRHDINYSTGSTATGNATTTPVASNTLGKSDNAVTAQFDMYF